MISQSVSENPVLKEYNRLDKGSIQKSEGSAISENIRRFLERTDSISKELIDVFPYPIFITNMDTELLLENEQASKLFPDHHIGERLSAKVASELVTSLHRKINQMVEQNIRSVTFEYKYHYAQNISVALEITVCLLTFREIPAAMVLTRNIGEAKRELLEAGSFQKGLLKSTLPFENDKIESEIVYVPARTVSGDFYFFKRIDDKRMMGIIGDVSGKGVAAALGISAFNVLFHEGATYIKKPYDLVEFLNKRSSFYIGERYVAACCFEIDFYKRQLRAVGAGINQFVHRKNSGTLKRYTVKGPFLGMFEDSVFEEEVINFEIGDEFIFYSDGMDFIFAAGEVDLKTLEQTPTEAVISFLRQSINNMQTNIDGLPDDCTMIVIKMK